MQQAEIFYHGEHIIDGGFVKNFWNADEKSPYFFSKAHYMIRTLLYTPHLSLAYAKNPHIIFRGYHSLQDRFDTARDKQTLFLALKELGFDATLTLIRDEKDIDGKFIKDLDHGMRISDRALFKKELPAMLEKLQGRKSPMQENSISYPCGDKIFSFEDKGDKFELNIKEKNGDNQ